MIEDIRELFQTLPVPQLEGIKGELKAVNAKIDGVQTQIDSGTSLLDAKIDSKIDVLDSKLNLLDSKIDSKIDLLMRRSTPSTLDSTLIATNSPQKSVGSMKSLRLKFGVSRKPFPPTLSASKAMSMYGCSL